MHLDPSNRLHRGKETAMECPHCRASVPMTATATPDFRTLLQTRPEITGIVFQCSSCGSPVFYRYRIKEFNAARIDFHAIPQEVEKPEERFSFRYLPDKIAIYFRDALGCYHHGLLHAFAAMCRLTTHATIDDLGNDEKLRIFAQVDEIAELANLSDKSLQLLRTILFESGSNIPVDGSIDRSMAAVLLETMKDMLQQSYIRRGRLRRLLRMRQFFATTREQEVSADDTLLNVETLRIKRPTGTGQGA